MATVGFKGLTASNVGNTADNVITIKHILQFCDKFISTNMLAICMEEYAIKVRLHNKE